MTYISFPGREEMANTLTHGIGAVASLVAGIVLVVLAGFTGDPWRIVGATVFGLSLVLLYTASTIYHGAPHGQTKRRLEILDHCAIFVLIAGTYTPFMLISLRGVWGWSLFGVIWALAIIGVVLKLVFGTRFSLLSTLIYIGMGWLAVIAAAPLIQALSPGALFFTVAGGLAYTGGTLFYHNRRIPFAHAIWHLFVIAGSACHVLAVAIQIMAVGAEFK